jgi:prenyltransferase beta subunit
MTAYIGDCLTTIREQSSTQSTPQNILYDIVASAPRQQPTNYDLYWETLKKYFEAKANLGTQDQSNEIVLPKEIEEQLDKTFQELNYSTQIAKSLAALILKRLVVSGYNDLKISKTGEYEFLTYVKTTDGSFKNILIDEEGDIELIFLPKDRSKTWNKLFFKEDGIVLSRIISQFNGMH